MIQRKDYYRFAYYEIFMPRVYRGTKINSPLTTAVLLNAISVALKISK